MVFRYRDYTMSHLSGFRDDFGLAIAANVPLVEVAPWRRSRLRKSANIRLWFRQLVRHMSAWSAISDIGQRIVLAGAANGRFGEAALRRGLTR
ncbi:hypothetical protein ACOXXX_08340 [Thalassococcus sp. BH17M4-6]|uniref:hypothetical protein n=1 Tax=Thalassococcus sp. BH17M4-6 TaxID=3413148 RepID=UPI003BCDCCAA